MQKLKLKPHAVIPFGDHFSIHLKDEPQEIFVSSSLRFFYDELKQEKSLHDIFLSLRQRNQLPSIRSLVLLIRQMTNANFFENSSAAPKTIAVAELKTDQPKHESLALALQIFTILFSLAGAAFFFSNNEGHDFFTEALSFKEALSAVAWLVLYFILRLTLIRKFVQWQCGFLPTTHFSFSTHQFGLIASANSLSSLSVVRQSIVWLSLILTPVLLSTAGYLLFRDTVGSSLMWLGFIFAMHNLNPMRDSDLSKFIKIFIAQQDWEHLLPYLKTKSLTAMAQKKVQSVKESRLVVFSTLSVLWMLVFFNMSFDLFLTNYPRWFSALQMGQGALAAGLVSFACFALFTYESVQSLITLVFGNLKSSAGNFGRKKNSGSAVSMNPAELKDQLSKFAIFEGLSEEQWKLISSEGQTKTLKKNQFLIREGEVGEEMFVLLKGSCEIIKKMDSGLERSMAILQEGSVFGEVALVDQVTRSASVKTLSECSLFVVSRELYEKIWAGQDSLQQNLKKRIYFSRGLSSSALMKDIPAEIADLFLSKGHLETHEGQKVLMKEGDSSHEFYIILEGSVNVAKRGVNVAQLNAGQFFGEIAILEERPRTATVTTNEKTVVLKLTAENFWNIISRNLSLALNIEATSLEREHLH